MLIHDIVESTSAQGTHIAQSIINILCQKMVARALRVYLC